MSTISRSSSFFATTHFNAVPSRFLSIAKQACLLSFKLSCSQRSLMTSTNVSMQPSESSLNSLGFLKVFLDLHLSRSLESRFLVAIASSVLFIISQVLAHVMASGATLVFVLESPGTFVVFEIPPFMMVLDPPVPILAALRGNGVDSHLFPCGSIKLTLVPCGFSVASLSSAIEFLNRASSLDCMAQELSAWSLLIVSNLVSRFHYFSFTVLYRFFISSLSFLICFSRSLSVVTTFPTSVVAYPPRPLPSNSSYPGSRSCCVLFPFLILGGPLRCTSTFGLSHLTLSSSPPSAPRLFLFP